MTSQQWLSGLGSLGLGLVWGWLLAQVLFPARPSAERVAFRTVLLRSLLPGVLSTASLGSILWAFAGLRGLLVFLIGAAFTFLLRFAWQRTLRNKVELSNHLSGHR